MVDMGKNLNYDDVSDEISHLREQLNRIMQDVIANPEEDIDDLGSDGYILQQSEMIDEKFLTLERLEELLREIEKEDGES